MKATKNFGGRTRKRILNSINESLNESHSIVIRDCVA